MQLVRTLTALLDAAVLATSTAVSVNANATRSLRSDFKRACVSGYADFDIIGHDIGNAYASDDIDYHKQCQGRSGCNAFTYAIDAKRCYFKSDPTSADPSPFGSHMYAWVADKPRVVSGLILFVRIEDSCPDRFFVVKNCDMPGFDAYHFAAPSFEHCTQLLSDGSGRYAFTWSDYQGGTCWMKSVGVQCKPTANMCSGVLLAHW